MAMALRRWYYNSTPDLLQKYYFLKTKLIRVSLLEAAFTEADLPWVLADGVGA